MMYPLPAFIYKMDDLDDGSFYDYVVTAFYDADGNLTKFGTAGNGDYDASIWHFEPV